MSEPSHQGFSLPSVFFPVSFVPYLNRPTHYHIWNDVSFGVSFWETSNWFCGMEGGYNSVMWWKEKPTSLQDCFPLPLAKAIMHKGQCFLSHVHRIMMFFPQAKGSSERQITCDEYGAVLNIHLYQKKYCSGKKKKKNHSKIHQYLRHRTHGGSMHLLVSCILYYLRSAVGEKT